jgi:hypothetical protein
MVPAKIEILIHIHCSPEPWPRKDAPVYQETIKEFVHEGLITASRGRGSEWRTTERGAAMIQHLTEVKLPVAVWVQPK